MTGADPLAYGVPHREPFLFVHSVLECEPGVRARCSVTFSGEEAFFRGHFPGNPIVPGVILTEALAQASGIAAGRPASGSSSYLLSAIRSMKFLRAVRPGEEILLVSEQSGSIGGLLQFQVTASVNGQKVAEGSIILSAV